jgi:hypothetical protein
MPISKELQTKIEHWAGAPLSPPYSRSEIHNDRKVLSALILRLQSELADAIAAKPAAE